MTVAKKTSHNDMTMEIEDILELFLIKLKELDQRLDKLERNSDGDYYSTCVGVS
ncbi:MAG: hypothetical protein ACXAEU_21595 [Candidatus Hodarchaeales archaeon]|jgi:hypothetical protein